MSENSKIEWTHHTFNPWWGCVRVSPGCEHCYAETFAKRVGQQVWGVNAPRRLFGDKHWNKPLKWDAAAEQAGERHRVFCASMADVFEDREDLIPHRLRLFSLIEATPHLDWLLLTKRPENIRALMPGWYGGKPWPNVWLGTTVEDQRRADERIPLLLQAPAVVRFLSCEPLLGPINFDRWPGLAANGPDAVIHWVIVGGESGHHARMFHTDWARSIIGQCRQAGVAVFVKQLGSDARDGWWGEEGCRMRLHDRKGGDPSEWPAALRIREFPRS